MSEPLKLDANASVPPLPAALSAMVEAVAQGENPSSPHASGQRARRRLDEARRAIASALGGPEKDVTLFSGASEANRWLIDALCRLKTSRQSPPLVMTSPLEHPSTARPLEQARQRGLLEVEVLEIDARGDLRFDVPRLAEADAVIVCSAHNETGVLPDLDALAGLLADDTVLISDAAQAIGRLACAPHPRADAVVASAHKLGGVAGAGALLLRARAKRLDAGWEGGGQEAGRRPGTEALGPQVAFGAACQHIDSIRAEHQALARTRDLFEDQLSASVSDLKVLGSELPRLPNTSCFVPAGVDGDALRLACFAAGLEVGFGSACSALAPEPSAALLAMGLQSGEARAAIRLSLAPGAGSAVAEAAATRLAGVIGSLRERAKA